MIEATERTVAGTIRQNDHVTVYATFKDVRAIHSKTLKAFLSGSSTEIPQEAPRGTFTVTVVDDVRVLRVSGEGTDSTSTGGDQQVTLEVAPADAARIVFAQENGTLWLGLLPPGEDGTHTDPVQVGQLLR